jgi:hypothetical protein
MKRLLDALFSVTHITIFVIAIWVGMAFMVAEAFGWFRPDYRRLLFVMILAYWAGVALELGVLGRRRARH